MPAPSRLRRPNRPRLKAPGSDKPAPAAKPAAPPTIEAKVWSLDDGHERAALSGHNGVVVALEFSHDGKTLATTSRAGVVKLWDTRTFQAKVAPVGRQGGVDLVQFSADGKTLVGANAAGLVTLWDVATGKARANFQHPGGMNMVVLSPDGKTLATGGSRVGSRGVDEGRPGRGPDLGARHRTTAGGPARARRPGHAPGIHPRRQDPRRGDRGRDRHALGRRRDGSPSPL